MRLTHLFVRGVRSIVEPVEITFPEQGLFLIKGENGAGKSSIIMAISHLLGYSIPATALQSFLTDEKFQVIGHFKAEEGEVVIYRGKRTAISINGTDFEGPKVVEQKLLEIFHGLDSDLRKLLTYRPQRKPGMFLSLPDGRKKEFMSSVIPELANYEKAISVSEAALEVLVDEELSKRGALEYGEREVAGITLPPIPELPTLNGELRTIEVLEESIAARSKTVAQKREHEKFLLAAVPTPSTSHLETRLREVVSLTTKAQDVVREQRGEVAGLGVVKLKLVTCVKNIEAAKVGKCPTCDQKWSQEQLLSKYENEKQTLIREAKRLMAIESNLAKDETLVGSLLVEGQELRNQIHTAMAEVSTKAAEAVSGIRQLIVYQLENIEDHRRNCEVARTTINNAKNKYTTALAVYNGAKARLDSTMESLNTYRKLYDEVAAKLNVERDCLALTKGFFNSIFDDILADISSRTNKILEQVDNVSEVVLEFRSSYETAKKTIQRRITPFVTFRGKELELEHGPSGGMYSSVELAVDLAVAEVVSHRSGFTPGFLILDEPFTGVSIKSKEAALEVLQAWAQDRLVVIVDHEGSFQGLFSNVIEVINNGSTTVKEAS